MNKVKQRRLPLDAPVTQGAAPERGDLLLGYDLSAGAPALFDPFDRPGPLGIGAAKQLPRLLVGGDHPYQQWWGTNGNDGMAQAYLDRGLRPYIAINTGDANAPGGDDMLTWEQCRVLQDRGVEFVSHGVWHVNDWEKACTGIVIQYLGANNNATVRVNPTSGSPDAPPSLSITCTSTGGSTDTVTSTFATDDTLAKVKATLEANGKWSVTYDPILDGTESPANLLGMHAARSIIAGGHAGYFCMGGGLVISYTGRTYENVYMRCSGTSLLIFGDGVQLYSGTYSTSSLQTIADAITAISGGEFTATLCDNGRSGSASQPSYCYGDEQANYLRQVTHADLTARPCRLDAGISGFEIVKRHFVQTKATAAAQGIYLKHFAQSGGGFYPWTSAGHREFGLYRGNYVARSNTPPVQRLEDLDRHVLHRTMKEADGFYAGQIRAIINGLTARYDALSVPQGGHVLCLLMHKVLADGSSGYSFPTNDGGAYYDLTEPNFIAMIEAIRDARDNGTLIQCTFDELYNTPRYPHRGELLYNAALATSGITFAGGEVVANGGYDVPGWGLVFPTTYTAISIANGAITCTSTNGTAVTPIGQEVQLKPGRTYELSVNLSAVSGYTSGAIGWSVRSMRGRVKDLQTPGTNVYIVGRTAFEPGRIVLRFTMPKLRDPRPAKLVSKNAETYNLGTNKNIKLNIQSIAAIDNLDCSAGAGSASAVKAKEVAAAINAAVAANASYPAEYHNCARAEAGKVIIEAPYIYPDQATNNIAVSAATSTDASSAIFGSTNNNARTQFMSPPTAEEFVVRVEMRSTIIGTFTLSDFSLTEVEIP